MNSELYDEKYKIPEPIVTKLKSLILSAGANSDGMKRAKFLVNNGYCTYQMLKGLKHFFDKFDVHKNTNEQFQLSGGDDMKKWVDTILGRERKRTSISKKNMQGLDVKTTTGAHSLTAQDGGVNMSTKMTEAYENEDNPIIDGEDDGVSDGVNDGVIDVNDGKKHNAIVVIFNADGNVLLVKRSTEEEWCPDKWALVGGGVEIGEQPEEAVKREVLEEIGLQLDNFNRAFGVETSPTSKLHVFTSYYDGDLYDITLNHEHSGYGWYSIQEMDYIDAVPNLVLYVSNALTEIKG